VWSRDKHPKDEAKNLFPDGERNIPGENYILVVEVTSLFQETRHPKGEASYDNCNRVKVLKD
jgi:hypothetical protein